MPFFLLVLLVYALGFHWIENRRQSHGPWQIAFTNSAGLPVMVINHPALHITNVMLRFPGTNVAAAQTGLIQFAPGRVVPFELPFGRCVFVDALFLPGTVACEVFGHQIQLMPRHLTIDGREQRWDTVRLLELPVGTARDPSSPASR